MDYSSLRKKIFSNIASDAEIRKANAVFLKKLEGKNATYRDAEEFSKVLAYRSSHYMSKELENVPVNELGIYAKNCVGPTYDRCQKQTAIYAKKVQDGIHKRNNIGIKSTGVVGDRTRINHIIDRFYKAASVDEVQFLVGKSVAENILRDSVMSTMKSNADNLERAGATTTMIRRSDGGCCAWCDSVTGEFARGEEPDGFWNFHKDCTCYIDYKCALNGTHTRIQFSTERDSKGRKRLYKEEFDV